MKQIDFAKPLRDNTGDTLTVVKEGLTLVRDTRGMQFVIDEWGDVQRTVQCAGQGALKVENVPEPERDHLHLYRREGGEWRIDFGSGQLFTKEQAEANSRVWARHAGAKNTVVVKVEV